MHLLKWLCPGLVAAAMVCRVNAAPVEPPAAMGNQASWTREFARLTTEIQKFAPASPAYQRLTREALRQEALILPADNTPNDVILRRTRALLNHLKSVSAAPDFAREEAALAALAARNQPGLSPATAQALFFEFGALRQRIAFKNPLLDFNTIAFLTHHKQGRGEIHMVDQYLGFNAKAGGDLYLLKNAFSGQPGLSRPLANARAATGPLAGGSFISLDLDYDASRLCFAWTQADFAVPDNASWNNQGWTRQECASRGKAYQQYFWQPSSCYHIFSANLDGSAVTRLTDGPHNDYDPCFLPNGRIAFISERIGGNQRCGARYAPTATLHAMMPDGSDIIPLSYHETNEWHPSVNNNGMLAYTRWDYVDRDSDVAHHLWLCNPDGRNPRSYHGNYPVVRESRPWMELSIRAIPNSSSKYVAVAAPHHGEAYGSLVLIDLAIPDDNATSQLRRITPEVHFPEAESAPGVPCPKGRHTVKGEVYGTPWPLSEDFFLCVYDPGQKHYGIYLVDSFGNQVLVTDSPDGVPCLDPIPLKPRPRPPVIPIATLQAQADRPAGTAAPVTGEFSVVNIYQSAQPLPRDTRITALRLVQVFPKPNAFLDVPRIGLADQSLARGVLGTVPVEADGSAYFTAPAGALLYFQALDAQGRAVHSMRSETYLHPGEHLSCIGCHESKQSALIAKRAAPLAFQRPPSIPKPEAPGAYPLTFPRLVQPVLDKQCVACHNGSPKAPDLSGSTLVSAWDEPSKTKKTAVPEKRLANGYTNGFKSLKKFGWGKFGGNGVIITQKDTAYSIPGQVGALASTLYPLLANGHHNVKLSPAEMRRITLWLDCNSNFLGAYQDVDKQQRGELVRPTLGWPAWLPPGGLTDP